jgi:hypothetical protein
MHSNRPSSDQPLTEIFHAHRELHNVGLASFDHLQCSCHVVDVECNHLMEVLMIVPPGRVDESTALFAGGHPVNPSGWITTGAGGTVVAVIAVPISIEVGVVARAGIAT